jgi:soluble lytic murein transglycosylase
MPLILCQLPLARLAQLLAITCLGTGAALASGQALLELGPKPNPDTPRQLLEVIRRLAPDPVARREASLLLASENENDPAAQQRLLKGQAWGPDPLAAVVLKRQALAAASLGESAQAKTLWQQLLIRFPLAPASADALYALGHQQPLLLGQPLRSQLLRNFAAHPAALAAAAEMASGASPSAAQQRQGALHLARWGVRWPGAHQHLERACQSKQGLTPWQRDQLAAGLAQLGDSTAATACLASQKPSRPTQLAIAKALLQGPANEERQGEQQLLNLARSNTPSPEAREALQLLGESDSQASLKALKQLPQALQAQAPVQARYAIATGNTRAALAVLERWPADPASWELQWQLARKALLASQWAQARALLAGAASPQLPPALAARQQFWLGFSLVQLGQSSHGRQLWRHLLREYPDGYYGWLAAVRLGAGDVSLDPNQAPPLQPAPWAPLKSGQNQLDRLWRLGQNQEAWETWRQQRGGRPPQQAPDLLLEGRLRQGVGDSWIGLGQLEEASLRLSPQQCQQRRQLAQAQATPRFTSLFATAGRANRLPASLLAAIAKQESRFSPGVYSGAGAVGLLQLMPETAAELYGAPLGTAALEEPSLNAQLGGRYLKQLLTLWDGNPLLAIASYNAGPGAVARWITPQLKQAPELWVEAIPYPETRLYVKKVLGNLWQFQQQRLPNC